MTRRRHRRGGRVTPKGTRPSGSQPRHSYDEQPPIDEPDLVGDIRTMVSSGHPLDLLVGASQLVELTTERPADRFARGGSERLDLGRLVTTFVDVDIPETTALLTALAAIVPDEAASSRIRRELANRRHRLPNWLVALDRIELTEVWQMVHILGDGDNILIGTRWPTGHALTAVAYIDHNVGSLLKDAFFIPSGIDQAVQRMRDLAADDDETSFARIDAALARARITEAIKIAEITMPPFASETWPGCRPALERIVGLLPEGATLPEPHCWTHEERAGLATRFFSSPQGAPLAANRLHHDLLDDLLWFGTDYGPGDPFHWSPVAVEIVLADWFPRKIVAPAERLAEMPKVLRALIEFAHAERNIPVHLTADTLAAVDHWEPEYQAVIRTDRPQGVDAIIEASMSWMGWPPDGGEDDESYGESMLNALARDVGGRDALDRLDTAPLPDEPFDWNAIADDVVERVQEVLDLTDRCCDEMLDVEYRTIARRLLARAARNDPGVFRRKARADYAAASLVWIVGKGNNVFVPYGRGLEVQDLAAWFGTSSSSVSQRAATLRKAAGIAGEFNTSWDIHLGTPALLHSERRTRIIRDRDRYRALG